MQIVLMVAGVGARDEGAGEEGGDEGLGGLGGAADDDLDAVLLKEVLGAGAHAAGEDDGGALFVQPAGKDAGFVGRWIKELGGADFLGGIVHVDHSEMGAMAEVHAELAVDNGNGDFHYIFLSVWSYLFFERDRMATAICSNARVEGV